MAMDNRERARRNRRFRLQDVGTNTSPVPPLQTGRNRPRGPAPPPVSLQDLFQGLFSAAPQESKSSQQPPVSEPKTLTAPKPPALGGLSSLRDLMASLGRTPDLSGYHQAQTLRDLASYRPEAPSVRRITRQAKDYLNRLGITGPSDLGGPSRRFQKLAYAKMLAQTAENLANREKAATQSQTELVRQLIGSTGSVLGTGLGATASVLNSRNSALRGALAALIKGTKAGTKNKVKNPAIDYNKWLAILRGREGSDPTAKLAADTVLNAYLQTGREPPPELMALANRVFLDKVQTAANEATVAPFRRVPWSDAALLDKANKGLMASQNPLMSAVASGQWRFDPVTQSLVPVGPRFGVEQADRKPIQIDLTDPVQRTIANLFRLRIDNGQR